MDEEEKEQTTYTYQLEYPVLVVFRHKETGMIGIKGFKSLHSTVWTNHTNAKKYPQFTKAPMNALRKGGRDNFEVVVWPLHPDCDPQVEEYKLAFKLNAYKPFGYNTLSDRALKYKPEGWVKQKKKRVVTKKVKVDPEVVKRRTESRLKTMRENRERREREKAQQEGKINEI